MSAAVKYLHWMTGSAWTAAASAGLAVVVSSSAARWLCVFSAVFNGILALYWAMMAVAAGSKPSEDK